MDMICIRLRIRGLVNICFSDVLISYDNSETRSNSVKLFKQSCHSNM